MGFIVRRVLRRGSEKWVSRRCLERPLEEHDPLGVRPLTKGANRNCSIVNHGFWRVPNPPGANPLVAERAFPTE